MATQINPAPIAQIQAAIPDLAQMLEQVSIHAISDIRPAAINFNQIANSLGLRIALCADIASGRQIMDGDGNSLNADIFGWVEDRERWWEDAHYALHSPIPRACRYESEPFWCDKHGFHTSASNPFLEGLDLKEYWSTNAVRYRSIIIVPIHLPFGQISANSCPVISDSPGEAEQIFSEYGHVLGTLTRRFITGYLAVTSKSTFIPVDCDLSKREVECMKWASIGKTDDEIGTIMSLCRSTVRYHVKRAGQKLEAVNRTQTVFKAAQLGYLSGTKCELS